ncbi:diacylglycerol O-acyltransferase 2-like [Leptopilina boulardi]|uniref:diacylglycerol O-acyltransferase 2-like n=1 Tax=Leptopilina boulardi TaxID=63433 RepID=UPI0021F5C61A|nr:diacylglycerol O-acyltransferase 2-like [Leptopilina boulardi]
MEIFGLNFAPANVPLRRRLQTLAATAWIISFAFGNIIGYILAAIILLFIPWLRIPLFIYFFFMYCDRNSCIEGGRSEKYTKWMRNCIWWHYFRDYFPIKLVKTKDLDPSRNYLFCSFPHGVLSTGIFCAFGTDVLKCQELFPGLDFRLLTLEQHFSVPILRELPASFGCCSASAASLEYLMSNKPDQRPGVNIIPKQGNAPVLVVGGASEALHCKPGTYRLVLRRRKGFLRLALKHGTPLVPVISFGETDLYDQINNPEGSLLRKLQNKWQKITGIAPVLALGRGIFQYTFGIVPHRKPITVVVGAPLEIPKIENPNQDEIDEYHEKFTQLLINLFESEKSKYLIDHERISLTFE